MRLLTKAATVLVMTGAGLAVAAALSSPAHAESPNQAARFGPYAEPQTTSTADATGQGANPGTACELRRPDGNPVAPGVIYCSMRHGAESLNGNGDGNATGRPCAGCVGRADNKNPLGQGQALPSSINGRLIQPDRNNGYECDGNNGIGRTNPAHTLCDP